MERNLNIVMYHYVRPLARSRYPRIKGLEYELFKEQISFFEKNFTFVRMEDVFEAIETGNKLPENAILLTFDDGYIDHFTYVYPYLKKRHIQGSFFCPARAQVEHKLLDVNKIHFLLASAKKEWLLLKLYGKLDKYRNEGHIIPSNESLYQEYAIANRFDDKDTIFIKRMLQEGLEENLRNQISSELFSEHFHMEEEMFSKELYMSMEQMECMRADGMFFGIHGYDHYWLGKIEESQMRKDIDKALEYMKPVVDETKWVMNFPYGSYNENVIEYIKKKGCRIGLTTEVDIANLSKNDCLRLPRMDTNDYPPKSENYLNYKR